MDSWMVVADSAFDRSPSLATFPLPCSAGPMGTPQTAHAALRKLSKQHAQ